MSIQQIRRTIDKAVSAEAAHGRFCDALRSRLPELRQSLLLPEDDPEGALQRFVTRYIRSVPSCLRLVTAVSKRQGFFDYVAPFLNLAEDYFLQPPEAIEDNGGLQPLLDEAFLAHRLLEEVNDHHIRHLQRPLLPVDMTEANIIVHHLLGDAFASRLEQLVQLAASDRLRHENLWDAVRARAKVAPQGMSPRQAIQPAADGIRLRLAS